MKNHVSAMLLTLFACAALAAAEARPGRVFTHKVVRTPSVVRLRGFRPTAQKGPTCNVYSAWMILHYYKVHTSAQRLKRDADGDEYKTSAYIAKKMNELGFEFLTFRPQNASEMAKIIKVSIDNGIPIQWGVNLSFSPFKKERGSKNEKKNKSKGHARLIVGYELKKGEIVNLLYADSWGGYHNLRKRMDLDSAVIATMDMHPIFPKDLDAKTAALLRNPLKAQPQPKFASKAKKR